VERLHVSAVHSNCEDSNYPQNVDEIGDCGADGKVAYLGFQGNGHPFQEQQSDDGEDEEAFDACAWPSYVECGGS
jgi:hypothetical protein